MSKGSLDAQRPNKNFRYRVGMVGIRSSGGDVGLTVCSQRSSRSSRGETHGTLGPRANDCGSKAHRCLGVLQHRRDLRPVATECSMKPATWRGLLRRDRSYESGTTADGNDDAAGETDADRERRLRKAERKAFRKAQRRKNKDKTHRSKTVNKKRRARRTW